MTAKIYDFGFFKRQRVLDQLAKTEAHTKDCVGCQTRVPLNFHTFHWQHPYFGSSDCGCPNGQSRWFQ
jgi:hypothetical protein